MSEMGFSVSITCDEPLIFSASSATAGGHGALDYIPGSALLGAAAAHLYRAFDDETAYSVFHSGAVRFGNAYPLAASGAMTLPAPLSLHYRKSESKAERDRKGFAQFIDKTVSGAGTGFGQLEQARGFYVSGDGAIVRIAPGSSMRTAILDNTGTADEGRLFSYSSIPAGTAFAGWIGFDEETHAKDIMKIFSGTVFLGRSRSAEHGRCHVEAGPLIAAAPVASSPRNGEVIVYCVSNIALIDPYGTPEREPRPEHFGLTGGRLDWARSFIRSRRYSPFVAAYRTYDFERAFIEKGSILVFSGSVRTGPTEGSTGAYRAQGYGAYLVDPAFLAGGQLVKWAKQSPPHLLATSTAPVGSSGRLAAIVAWRTGATYSGAEWAAQFEPQLDELYATAANLDGTGRNIIAGPSASQWGRLQNIADAQTTLADFQMAADNQQIFGSTDDSGGQKPDPDWSTTGQLGGSFLTFAEWFQNILGGDLKPRSMDDLRALLRLAVSVAKNAGGER